MKKQFFLIIIFITVINGWLFLIPKEVLAYKIEDLANVKVEGDFTVGPGKTEVFLDPGGETTREVYVTNRTGRTTDFRITLEDFMGTRTGETPLVLLGAERGPYSLKDYLKPEALEFTLAHGQRMVLPVEISIPENAEPGGRYGAVLVSAVPPELEGGVAEGETKGQIRVVGRVSCLFFVRVKGDVSESGFLRALRMADGKKIYQKGPLSFELLFENNGSVHLNPYGIIEIKNLLGKKIGEVEIQPWFAMPDSLRSRVVTFERKWLFGRYIATAKINRGYKDIIDEKSVTFWVLPWIIILPVLIAIVLLVLFARWFLRKFEIRLKKKA